MILKQQNEKSVSDDKTDKLPCRYCKLPVQKGDRRCPHCGTLNPSMDVKRSLVWTVGVIAVLYVVNFAIHYLGGK